MFEITSLIIALVAFGPGFLIMVNVMSYLYKNGHRDLFWKYVSPITLLMIIFILPIYSFAFYTSLAIKKKEKLASMIILLEESYNDPFKKAVVIGMAKLLRIKLDESPNIAANDENPDNKKADSEDIEEK